jgi:hypothetical protein
MPGLQRFHPQYNDLLGKVQSAQSGGTSWSIEAITGTPFIIGALRNNSSDLVQVTIQVPHGRKLQSVLASIHLHYVLQAASGLNETIIWTGSYVWINHGEAIPATAQWTAFSGVGLTQNLGSVKPIRYYSIHTIQADIPAPVNETYGGMLLIHLVRGNGTYTANLGILDIDAHSLFDRIGSGNESSDT